MLIKMKAILLFLYLLNRASAQSCFDEESRYTYFGSKTFYRDVNGTLPNSSPAGCSPIFIYLISRHGARYPDEDDLELQKDVENFAENINETGRATLCSRDLELLKSWRPWTNRYNDKNLTTYGASELLSLASRYQAFLPEILGLHNNPEKFRFSSTDKMRNIDSMNAFVSSLFNNSNHSISETQIDDVLPQDLDPLEFDDFCPRFIREVDDNPDVSLEYEKFIRGPMISAIARRLTKRLGLSQCSVSNDFVWTLYSTCYDQRWVTTNFSPWCRIFSQYDFKVLEYASDVEDYPTDGYKFPISYEQNCFLAKEIVQLMRNATTSDANGTEPELLGRFRFASNKNILTLAATLKLYQEQPGPTATSYKKQHRRSFRTSIFAPSSANIAFVLYRCNGSTFRDNSDDVDYSFQTFWNEKLLFSYPGCPQASRRRYGLCNFAKWMRRNQEYVLGSSTECNQTQICQ